MKLRKYLQNLFKNFFRKFFLVLYGKVKIDNKLNENEPDKVTIKKIKNFSLNKSVYQIKNGRIYTDTVEHVAIITNNTIIPHISYQQVLGDLKKPEFNKVLHIGTPRFLKKFNGQVLSLVQGASGQNYFHFLFDIIGKLLICERVMPLNTINYFYVHEKIDWQIKILSLFGINEHKLISSKKYMHIKADNIVAIEHPWYQDGFVQSQIANLPEWLIIELREKFLSYSKKFDCNENVFIDRTDSNFNHSKLKNNNEVIEYLNKRGFTSYQVSKLNFFEQIYLFSNAKVIIGPHGAAFSNIIFSKPKTKIIELITEDHPSVKCQRISKILDLNYTRIKIPKVFSPNNILGDMEIQLKEIDDIIN